MLVSQSSLERLDKFTKWSKCLGNDINDECLCRKLGYVHDISRRVLSGWYNVHDTIRQTRYGWCCGMYFMPGWNVLGDGWEIWNDSDAMFGV